jgi:hypothetical protein
MRMFLRGRSQRQDENNTSRRVPTWHEALRISNYSCDTMQT